jgi:hypothetical protein
LLSGCASVTPDALRANSLDKAAVIDRNLCAGGEGRPEAGAFPVAPIQAESVEPLYLHVHSGRNGIEARLQGAALHLRARPDVSSEWLAHEIECHTAKALLGAEQGRADQASPDDPFVVAGGWVDASVRIEGGSFVVTLRPEDPDRAMEVLARAEAFLRRSQQLALH